MTEKNMKKIAFRFNNKNFLVNAKICKSVWSQGWGKMFSFNRDPIVFIFPEKREVDIHMLFVFMPLLVVWFDEKMNVVKAEKMKPFVSGGRARANYVLEIPLKK
jgi:uncharacterized membrane protein (UPF0127 family)